MLLIPQRLYGLSSVNSILYDGQSCILTKYLEAPTLNRQSYISTPVLSYVQKGSQQIKSYDGEIVNVAAGQLVVLPKGIYTVSDLIPDNQAFETILFFIDDSIIDAFLTQSNWSINTESLNKSFYFHTEAFPLIRIYTEGLRQLYTSKSLQNETLLRLKLLELLHLFMESEKGAEFIQFLVNTRVGKKRNLRTFMDANFDKPLKVEDYAYLTGRSLSSFRRDFKQYFATTPQQWLKDKRLEKALELLLNANENVTNVAYEVGYENISYFIKEFKKKYTLTPKQYILKERQKLMT